MNNDTIIAPATPSGVGGLAVIRISGAEAEPYLQAAFQPYSSHNSLRSHQLVLGQLVTADGLAIDEVMAVVMRAPHSFTREDVVEIHCHGGPAIVRSVLDRFLSVGARMAQPGEFTQRAFTNGRLDLSQAEAVADLIHAQSSGAARVALGQLQGKLSRVVTELYAELISVLSLVELHIDFSDQDVDLPEFAPLGQQVSVLVKRLRELLAGFDSGRLLHEGASILILGKPNVGKSSLLNALLGEARAIVTEIPGTTRDTIEESLCLHDVPIRLIDTAGIRQTDDLVEREGVRRACEKISSADMVLLVIDGSVEPDEDDMLALSFCDPVRTITVCNKFDLGQAEPSPLFSLSDIVTVSVKTGEGLDRLQEKIRLQLLAGGETSEDVLLYERRHRDSLQRATGALERFVAGVELPLEAEILSFELREAIGSLGEVTGETVTEAVLEQIFSKFCIGK